MADCGYSEEIEVLINCTNLKTLRIKYCDYMIPMKILDNNKISTFDMVECQIDAQEVALILEKSGGLLQRLKFESEDEEFQKEPLLIKSFCPIITYLSIQWFGFSTQLVELIGSLKNLQFLSLWCDVVNMPKEELNIRIMQFSEYIAVNIAIF
ncbi:hypothetical protein C2G38_2027728 [Gigaspora rosea]|uniref:F-box domain-containing protein n=1 Tax=Gigaspora rosea TaxID=44941 RepID=A0A397WA36_9GLOM|nr:hypothetical protein C2G38_2027728 [Gigaspora rosea]